MDLFDAATIQMYYTGSWVLHPETNSVVLVEGMEGDNLCLREGKRRYSVHKDKMDWKHVKTPELGYRTHPNGHYVIYVERAAGRTAHKGFNAHSIRVSVPDTCSQVHRELGTYVATSHRIDESIARAVFNPTFLPIGQAITQLTKNPKASGYALSPSWAICLGIYAGAEFLLFLKGTHVATSTDGYDWQWLDDAARDLFERSSVR